MTAFKALRDFLAQPYPYYYRGKQLFIVLLLVFVAGLLFNYLVEPFHVNRQEHRMDFFWISVIHSLTPLSVLVLLALPTSYLQNGAYESWNVRKEFFLLLLFLLLTGVGQFLIRDLIYDNPNNWSWGYLLEEIRNTFIVGTIIILVFVPTNFNRLYLLNSQRAERIIPLADPGPEMTFESNDTIFIKTQLQSDDFSLSPTRFMYARSDKNYVEVFLREKDQIVRLVKRMTIKEMEAQLSNIPFILRIHRSYLVNLHQIEKVSGNAQGYRLRLKAVPGMLPVSRTMIPDFEQKLGKTA